MTKQWFLLHFGGAIGLDGKEGTDGRDLRIFGCPTMPRAARAVDGRCEDGAAGLSYRPLLITGLAWSSLQGRVKGFHYRTEWKVYFNISIQQLLVCKIDIKKENKNKVVFIQTFFDMGCFKFCKLLVLQWLKEQQQRRQ